MNVRKEDFDRDRFAAANGIELIEVEPGRAVTRLETADRHVNSVELIHGGAIFTLAAVALFAAANAAGQAAVGVNLSITFLRPVQGGTLSAVATEISRSRRLSTCTVEVTDETGEQVAMLNGTAYIKDEEFPVRSEP